MKRDIDNWTFDGKRGIICDLDGTLIDSIGIWNSVDRKLITSNGKIPRESVGLERTKFLSENNTGDIFVKYAEYLLRTYDIKGYTPEEFCNIRKTLGEEYNREMVDYKPGAADFLLQAKAYGYKLILASLTRKGLLDIFSYENINMKDKLPIAEIFDYIITRDMVKNKKPDPEVYQKAIQLSGFSYDKLIVLEDELMGVRAAKSANLDVINIYDKYSDNDRVLLDRYSDYQTNDYFKLTRKL